MVVVSHVFLGYFPALHDAKAVATNPSWVEWLANSNLTFFYRGGLAVMIFFVLSGYVLTHGYCAHQSTTYVTRAVVKRYIRLGIPVFAACIFGGIAFGVTISTAIREGLFGSLLFAEAQSNYVLWTISYELYGSLLIFAVLGATGEYRRVCLLAFAITSFILITQPAPFIYFALFGVGAILRLLLGAGAIPGRWRAALGGACLIAGLWLGGYQSNIAPYSEVVDAANFVQFRLGVRLEWPLLFPGVAAALIVFGFLLSASVQGVFATKPIAWLGKVSFGCYLLHPMILAWFEPWSKRHFGVGSASMLVCLGGVIAATLLAASIFYRLVDKRSVDLANRFAKWAVPSGTT